MIPSLTIVERSENRTVGSDPSTIKKELVGLWEKGIGKNASPKIVWRDIQQR